ncbi:MAG: GNAT family N-acetyltransferase [Planctomycetes bacterium]|nr:GNAT family N-acetyltransferase [Planctomycetota bacterium]
MATKRARTQVEPLTLERWDDFVDLLGPRGACGGCWCMTSRLPKRDYAAGKGEKNKRAMKKLVASEHPTGLLAYRDGKAVGWCSIAPRSEFAGLAKSRFAKPVDARDAWAISCLYVDREHRGTGVATALVRAATEHAFAHGAECVDAWPHETKRGERAIDLFVWMGLRPCFDRAGFTEVARHTPARPTLRAEPARNRRARR